MTLTMRWDDREVSRQENDARLAEVVTRSMQLQVDAALMQREDVRTFVGWVERTVVLHASVGAITEERAAFLLAALRGGAVTSPSGSVIVVPAPVVNIANHVDARPPQGDLQVEPTKTGGLKLTRTPAKSATDAV